LNQVSCSIVDDIADEEELISGIDKVFNYENYRFKKVDCILIKPNLCYYWDASTGQTTSPKFVGALIEYIRDNTGNDPRIIIGEADASAMRTKHAFKMLGYDTLASDKEVELLNLSRQPIVEKNTSVRSKEIKLSFSKEILEADILINVPKLKYHRVPKVTCGMKNIFGAIAKRHKYSYHPKLTETIVAANKIIRSDLILVDGLVALGNYPKIMKTILLGQDVLTVDGICSKILGFDPRSVEHLKVAENEGLGKISNVKVVGDMELPDLIKLAPPASYWKQKILWGIQLTMVDLYNKIVGDVVPPMLLKE